MEMKPIKTGRPVKLQSDMKAPAKATGKKGKKRY